MIKKPITIQIPSGLEARPVALLVQVASQFESDIYVESEQRRVNAKSIMGMMTLGLTSGKTSWCLPVVKMSRKQLKTSRNT